MIDKDMIDLCDPNVPEHCRRAWVEYLSDGPAKRHLMRRRRRWWQYRRVWVVSAVVALLWLAY